ncbi:hypothetical protein ACJROX_15780 [Pseudalkalibacillus sp. A8]
MNDSRIESIDKEWVALILRSQKAWTIKAEVQIFLRAIHEVKLKTVTK